MFKASLKFKGIAGAMVTAFALLSSQNANAIAYALEPTQLANFAQLQSANSLLSLLVSYTGNIPGSTVVGALATILGQLKYNAQLENATMVEGAQRARLKDAEQRYYDAEMHAMPSVQQCQDITQGSSRGGAGAAGSAASKLAAAADVTNALTTKSDAGSAGRIVSSRQANNTCSQDDVNHGRTGCGSVGTMPSADASATTFFQTMTASYGVKGSNLTYTPDQAKLILNPTSGDTLASHMINPFPAPVLPDAVEKTPQGLTFLALKLAATLRLSTASYAMSQITGFRTADTTGQFSGTRTLSGGTTATAWGNGDVQKIYARMFPNDQFPTAPSQAEVLRYEVASRYVDMGDGSWQLKIATMNPDDMQREQLKLQAIQAYVQWQQLQRTEEANAMLASLVASQHYPINNQTLQSASQDALRNQRGTN